AVVLYMKALIGTFLAAGLACGGCVVTWQKPRHCCPSSRGEDGGAPKLGLKARRPPGAAARPPPVDGADGEAGSSKASTPQMPLKNAQVGLADWARLVAAAAAEEEVLGFGAGAGEREARRPKPVPEQLDAQKEAVPPPPLTEPRRPPQLPQRVRSVAPPERLQEPSPSPRPAHCRPERPAPAPAPTLPRCRSPATPPPSAAPPDRAVVATPPVQAAAAPPPPLGEPKEVVAGGCEFYDLPSGGRRVSAEGGASDDPRLEAAEQRWWGVRDGGDALSQ
ncbi:unnamed protein product, partial [Prorocentrum cordatum]